MQPEVNPVPVGHRASHVATASPAKLESASCVGTAARHRLIAPPASNAEREQPGSRGIASRAEMDDSPITMARRVLIVRWELTVPAKRVKTELSLTLLLRLVYRVVEALQVSAGLASSAQMEVPRRLKILSAWRAICTNMVGAGTANHAVTERSQTRITLHVSSAHQAPLG